MAVIVPALLDPESYLTDPDQPNVYIQALPDPDDQGCIALAAYTTEYLARHVAANPDLMSRLLDEDGWLTPEAKAATLDVVRQAVGSDPTVEASDECGGEEPHISFYIDFCLPQGSTEVDAWSEAASLFAEVYRLTDPAADPTTYLFAAAAHALAVPA